MKIEKVIYIDGYRQITFGDLIDRYYDLKYNKKHILMLYLLKFPIKNYDVKSFVRYVKNNNPKKVFVCPDIKEKDKLLKYIMKFIKI